MKKCCLGNWWNKMLKSWIKTFYILYFYKIQYFIYLFKHLFQVNFFLVFVNYNNPVSDFKTQTAWKKEMWRSVYRLWNSGTWWISLSKDADPCRRTTDNTTHWLSYSLSHHFKPAWFSFFCGTQKKKYWSLFSVIGMNWDWGYWVSKGMQWHYKCLMKSIGVMFYI